MTTTQVPAFCFTAILEGNVDAHLDELFEAGCRDATFRTVDGVAYADFCREAPTLPDALISAIKALESVGGVHVMRIEPEPRLRPAYRLRRR